MKRRLIKEAPTKSQIDQFSSVLKDMFGDNCQMALKMGHGETGVIFYSPRDYTFTKVNLPSGKIEDLGSTRPRMFEPVAQGADYISQVILQNAEPGVGNPIFLKVVESLFAESGKVGEFSGAFATNVNAPLTRSEREELTRLRLENASLKEEIEKLRARTFGIPRGPASQKTSKYSDLEID